MIYPMLILCHECKREVSDKALSCPHCGYPMVDKLKSYPQKSHREKSRKRKRLPNGFGQITKVKGNLRNPYRAMVTVGKTEDGKPICKLLKPQSYFKTYNDAYTALIEYNKSPYELPIDITCQEIYERWIEEFEKKKSASMVGNMKSTWKHCSELHNVPVNTIRIRHIKGVMKDHNVNTKKRIKTLWNHLLDYAMEYEVLDKNYSRMFAIDEKRVTQKLHIIFTEEEMSILWRNKHDPIVSMILIQCFMGWRPRELCEIKIEDVNLKEDIITGGMKTDAGKKRRVYVLPAIKEMVEKWYNNSSANNSLYLFTTENGNKFDYFAYRYRFNRALKQLSISTEHRPHDPRKHFITMAKKAKVDEYAIKKIVGHDISDITEKIYTDRDSEWLKHEMLRINDCMNNV